MLFMKLISILHDLASNRHLKHEVSQYILNNLAIKVGKRLLRPIEFELYFKSGEINSLEPQVVKSGLKVPLSLESESYILITSYEDELGELKSCFDKLTSIDLELFAWPIEEIYNGPRLNFTPSESTYFHLFKNYRFFIKPEKMTKGMDLFYLSMKARRRLCEVSHLSWNQSHIRLFEEDFYTGLKLDKKSLKEVDTESKSGRRKLYGHLFKKLFYGRDMLKHAHKDIYEIESVDAANVYLELAAHDQKENATFWLTWAEALNQRGHYTAAMEALLTSFYLDSDNKDLYIQLLNTSLLAEKFYVTINLIERSWEKLGHDAQLSVIESIEDLMEAGEIELTSLPAKLKVYYSDEKCV